MWFACETPPLVLLGVEIYEALRLNFWHTFCTLLLSSSSLPSCRSAPRFACINSFTPLRHPRVMLFNVLRYLPRLSYAMFKLYSLLVRFGPHHTCLIELLHLLRLLLHALSVSGCNLVPLDSATNNLSMIGRQLIIGRVNTYHQPRLTL